MVNTALQTIATKALPALSGEQVTYNVAKNVFLTMSYTSAVGKTVVPLAMRLAKISKIHFIRTRIKTSRIYYIKKNEMKVVRLT